MRALVSRHSSPKPEPEPAISPSDSDPEELVRTLSSRGSRVARLVSRTRSRTVYSYECVCVCRRCWARTRWRWPRRPRTDRPSSLTWPPRPSRSARYLPLLPHASLATRNTPHSSVAHRSASHCCSLLPLHPHAAFITPVLFYARRAFTHPAPPIGALVCSKHSFTSSIISPPFQTFIGSISPSLNTLIDRSIRVPSTFGLVDRLLFLCGLYSCLSFITINRGLIAELALWSTIKIDMRILEGMRAQFPLYCMQRIEILLVVKFSLSY